MDTIARLITTALYGLFECNVIDWTPDDGAPESFLAECEIEQNMFGTGDVYITMCGVLSIVNSRDLDNACHASKLAMSGA